MAISVNSQQRFTLNNKCPICHGYDGLARDKGIRCSGFLSHDGTHAYCTREEHAGALDAYPGTEPPAYAHRLDKPCRCGVDHGGLGGVEASFGRWPTKVTEIDPQTFHFEQRGGEITDVRIIPKRVCDYLYRNGHGAVVYRVARYEPKTFRPEQLTPDGEWRPGLEGVERVPYRLPELLAADPKAVVFVCEGEKDADALAALGLVATTNPGGTGGKALWSKPAFRDPLKGRRVVVLIDNDDAGRSWAEAALAALAPVARTVAPLALPVEDEGADVSDWLADDGTADELARLAQAALRAAGGDTGLLSLGEALDAYFEGVASRQAGAEAAVKSGFTDLDRLLGGFKPGDLIILAARPGVGKSAWAFNAVRNAAAAGHASLVFSLEMSAHQIAERLLAAEAGVEASKLREGFVSQEEWARVGVAYEALRHLPVWLDESGAPTFEDVKRRTLAAREEHGVAFVVVDYLQLLRAPDVRGDRHVVVGEISRGLKALAREAGVPVLALSQLSRAVESRQDHRPMLSDLRESGSLEQDADVVIFINRDDLNNPQTDRKGVADLVIAKNRNGPTGAIPLRFFAAHTRFTDLETYRVEEQPW